MQKCLVLRYTGNRRSGIRNFRKYAFNYCSTWLQRNTRGNISFIWNKRPHSKLRGIERGRPTTYSRICYTALPPVLFYIVSYTHFLFLDFLHSFLLFLHFHALPPSLHRPTKKLDRQITGKALLYLYVQINLSV